MPHVVGTVPGGVPRWQDGPALVKCPLGGSVLLAGACKAAQAGCCCAEEAAWAQAPAAVGGDMRSWRGTQSWTLGTSRLPPRAGLTWGSRKPDFRVSGNPRGGLTGEAGLPSLPHPGSCSACSMPSPSSRRLAPPATCTRRLGLNRRCSACPPPRGSWQRQRLAGSALGPL